MIKSFSKQKNVDYELNGSLFDMIKLICKIIIQNPLKGDFPIS
jgi:hypothetical protein